MIVRLAWDGNVIGATGYNLYYGPVSGSKANVIKLGNTLAYDADLGTGTWFFQVAALSNSQEGPTSNIVSKTVSGLTAFNFRQTQGFVADGTNEKAILGTGWNKPVQVRDRNTSADRRLAGINFVYNNTPASLVYDFAPGVYEIRLALGDYSWPHPVAAQLLDGATLLAKFDSPMVAAGSFMDATGAVLAAANWPAQNKALQKTIKSGKLTLLLGGGPIATEVAAVAHLSVNPVLVGAAITLTSSDARTLVLIRLPAGNTTGSLNLTVNQEDCVTYNGVKQPGGSNCP